MGEDYSMDKITFRTQQREIGLRQRILQKLSRRSILKAGGTLAAVTLAPVAHAQTAVPIPTADNNLPPETPPFEGTVGDTYKTSESDFPQPVAPPKGAPNVIIILIDDLVFCPGNSLTKSRELLEDGVSGSGPHEGV
jgi:hypothetical protein